MNRRFYHVIFPLAAALSLQLRGADLPFIVDVWGTSDGLPQSSVIALTQTRAGYLWLGTLTGLVRFDGHSFTRFNVNNTPGLPSDRVIFLFEDSHANLWMGTETAGICCLKNGTVQNLATSETAGKVSFAFEDKDGNVWFAATDGKVFCWKNGKLDFQPPMIPTELFFRAFHLHVTGNNNALWQLQKGHIEKWRDGKLEKDFGASPWGSSMITAVFKTPEGKIASITFDSKIHAACEDPDGNLVVGTAGEGLFRLD